MRGSTCRSRPPKREDGEVVGMVADRCVRPGSETRRHGGGGLVVTRSNQSCDWQNEGSTMPALLLFKIFNFFLLFTSRAGTRASKTDKVKRHSSISMRTSNELSHRQYEPSPTMPKPHPHPLPHCGAMLTPFASSTLSLLCVPARSTETLLVPFPCRRSVTSSSSR